MHRYTTPHPYQRTHPYTPACIPPRPPAAGTGPIPSFTVLASIRYAPKRVHDSTVAMSVVAKHHGPLQRRHRRRDINVAQQRRSSVRAEAGSSQQRRGVRAGVCLATSTTHRDTRSIRARRRTLSLGRMRGGGDQLARGAVQ